MALAWVAVDEDAHSGDGAHAAPVLRATEPKAATGEMVQAVEAAATRSFSVLVVDDEASVRSTLAAILESAGHHVIEAEDGRAALQLLQENAIDVLVLDLHMPRIDGLTVLRQIQVPPPVVIVYSAFALYKIEAVRDQVGAKVFRFMRKPVPPIELIAAVNEAAIELDR